MKESPHTLTSVPETRSQLEKKRIAKNVKFTTSIYRNCSNFKKKLSFGF